MDALRRELIRKGGVVASERFEGRLRCQRGGGDLMIKAAVSNAVRGDLEVDRLRGALQGGAG